MNIDHKAAEVKPSSVINSKSNQKKSKRKVEANVKATKKWKGRRWRRWDIKVTFNLHKYEPPSEEEIRKVCFVCP